MKLFYLLLFCLLFSFASIAQTSYTGHIDKYPIELLTDVQSDGFARAIYVYTKYDEPIAIDGKLEKGTLTLFEKDKDGSNKASLIFENFDPKNSSLKGIWNDFATGRQLDISLKKALDIDYGHDIEWTQKEIIQPYSLKDHYFKLVVSKQKDDIFARVTAVKILQKKTDKLLQEIVVDCQLWGLDNISVGDFNFDGQQDFSIFEASYAGPNTTSLYFLFNPKTGKYFESGFAGTSLEFDHKNKRIYEHNQCCAGRSHVNAEYKVVDNKMVLIKQTCLEYDETIDELKEVKCE